MVGDVVDLHLQVEPRHRDQAGGAVRLAIARQHDDLIERLQESRAVRLFHAFGAMTSKEKIALVNLAQQIVAGRK